MRLILLDGGPASGKNTLGELIVAELNQQSVKAFLMDLDNDVESINPTWTWNDPRQESIDQEQARVNFARKIDSHLQQEVDVVAIGERFITKENITSFISRLTSSPKIQLFHLSVPYLLRESRLDERGPHPLIDLAKDQKDRDENTRWYGYVYENENVPTVDAQKIVELINDNQGLIDAKTLSGNQKR